MNRNDFPILKRKVHGKDLVYFDNAATTQKPRQVIEAIKKYYEEYNSNVHRAVHQLSAEATEAYDKAHEKAAEFINAEFEEIIFTKNTTESINIVANSFLSKLKPGDEIVLTQMEHHSNIVPWQQAAKKTGARIKYIEIDEKGELKLQQLRKTITDKTKIVAVTHVSNVLGTINPIKKICRIAHEKGATVLVDAAQSVPHMPVDVKELDCDFLAFSAHKMLGPTGIGVLYGKKDILGQMEPMMFGGDMIKEVTFETASWNELPWKFEAGTPNMAGAAGLAAAIDYLKSIGMDKIRQHDYELTKYATEKLQSMEGIEIYGPSPEKKGSVISFNLKNVHPHDVSSILDSEGIAVRGGHHCAMPLMKLLGIQGSVRASFYLYNTKEEIDLFAKALEKARKIMND
ncbi:cysteine desulfurase [Candidatus Woesearchaeota archaeon]|nr:cysteine desulfurase [Candidatus Woesearchaeota archaeon]